jgi:thioredoxin reductase (NADPH)
MINYLKSLLIGALLPFASMSGKENVEPVVILGGGVGSLTSAIYLGRAAQSPLVIEGSLPGGLLTQSHSVQNWPGEMEITGEELTEKMRAQAKANGARFVNEEVVAVDFSKRPLLITTKALDGSGRTRTIQAASCIIAMGSKPNFLGIPGEQTYWGNGVTNCAICDGSLYKGKKVAVVGGGDAAILEALYLSNIAKQVDVYVRGQALKASEEKRIQQLKQKGNVQFFYGTSVSEVKGDDNGVNAIVVKSEKGARTVPVDGLFLAIGSTPNSAVFKGALELDLEGYVILTKDQQTSIPGVYAMGDISDRKYKQAISAAGDGAKAALQAEQYLSDSFHAVALKEESKEIEVVSEVIEIDSEEHFRNELSQSNIPVVVDFYATWCGPCKKISPIMDLSAQALAGKVKFLKVNVDHFSELSATYNIRAMPTVILLDAKGKQVDRRVGFDPIADLLKVLQEGR